MPRKQTDRQTLQKGTWWLITAFKDSDISTLKDNQTWPRQIKKVYGGMEECPDTKRLHFQGAIQCNSQVRFSCIQQWLPSAHIELAKAKDAVVKYAMKEETAVGDKLEVDNSKVYWDMEETMKQLAEASIDFDMVIGGAITKKVYDTEMYWHAVRKILLEHPYMVSTFMRKELMTTFINTRSVWLALRASRPGPSITAQDVPTATFRITIEDECPICNEVGCEC